VSAVGRLGFALTERLRGSRSAALYREIAEEPFRPVDEVRARQLARLQALLQHAQRTVPYYRELFAGLGVDARDIKSFDDFARLPVLTKSVVRERGADMLSEAFPREALVPHHSGGSTGEPLSFFHSREYMAASEAGRYRNLAQCGWRPGEMVAFFWGFNKQLYSMRPAEFVARQMLRRQWQFDSFDAGPEAFAQWARTWRRIRPTVAYGYTSAMAQFCEWLVATGERVPAVRGAFTTAEKLYPAQRTAIEQALGCTVFDCYGSSEVREIATQCRAGRMHVNADFVVLENAPPDASGMVPPLVVTSLWSHAMPFIRYRNEDCGELLEGSCDCGNHFPLMKLEVGRTSDHFVLPDGRVVHGLFFIHRFYGTRGVQSFQFHQVSTERVVLYVVPTTPRPADLDATVRGVVADIDRLLGVALPVEVVEVATIPRGPTGKHRYVRSDVAAPASAASLVATGSAAGAAAGVHP